MAFISGLEVVPASTVYEQNHLAQVLGTVWKLTNDKQSSLNNLFQKTGITQRGSWFPHFETSDSLLNFLNEYPTVGDKLSLFNNYVKSALIASIENTLEQCGWSANEVTHLVAVSCTGIMAPGLDSLIPQWIGLNQSVERLGLYFNGCYAGIKALRICNQLARPESESKILVVCVEACTLHFPKIYSNDGALSSALFSDGLVSFGISSSKPKGKHFNVSEAQTLQIPSTQDLMQWNIGPSEFGMVLSREVPQKLEDALKQLQKHSINRVYAIHPGGPKILEKVAQALLIPKEKMQASEAVLSNCGNMSSGTVFHILQHLVDKETITSDNEIEMLAFGPGLTMERALVNYYA